MENLYIEATSQSPRINFNVQASRYVISGRSLPENAMEFYEPILIWLGHMEASILSGLGEGKQETHTFVFDLDYYNSASGKYIYGLVERIDLMYNEVEGHPKNADSGVKIAMEWHYGDDDEFMQEAGEEMQDITEMDILIKVR